MWSRVRLPLTAVCVFVLLGVQTSAASAATSLYHASWQSPAPGWETGGGRWVVRSALLTNTIDDPSSALAPYRVSRANYAVVATIRLAAWTQSGTSENNEFGILFRGAADGGSNPATGLVAGVTRGFLDCDGLYSWAGVATADTDTEVLKETSKFRPEHSWHTYRVEVRGNALKVFVDGKLRNAVTSKRLASQVGVGLYALAARIQVRDFKVLGL